MTARARPLLLPLLVCCVFAWLVADHVAARGSGPDTGERVIPYSGRLELNGNAVSTADVPMTFTLRGELAGGGEQTWSYGPVPVDVASGAFTVRIGEGASIPDWVYAAEATYVSVAVGDDLLQGEQRIYPVPFATWAAEASDLVVAGSLTVEGPITASSLTTTGDIRSTAVDGQLAVTSNFAFRDTGDTWLRLRTGAFSDAYADLAVGQLWVETSVVAPSLSTGTLSASGAVNALNLVASNTLCVAGTCGSPYISCDWSGGRWVYGDQGCADDMLFVCTNGRVTAMDVSC